MSAPSPLPYLLQWIAVGAVAYVVARSITGFTVAQIERLAAIVGGAS